MSAFSIALLIFRLAPELRDAVAELAKAFRDGDNDAARRAYEAARRAAFKARQK